jgi:hypothetical protein
MPSCSAIAGPEWQQRVNESRTLNIFIETQPELAFDIQSPRIDFSFRCEHECMLGPTDYLRSPLVAEASNNGWLDIINTSTIKPQLTELVAPLSEYFSLI